MSHLPPKQLVSDVLIKGLDASDFHNLITNLAVKDIYSWALEGVLKYGCKYLTFTGQIYILIPQLLLIAHTFFHIPILLKYVVHVLHPKMNLMIMGWSYIADSSPWKQSPLNLYNIYSDDVENLLLESHRNSNYHFPILIAVFLGYILSTLKHYV